MIDVALRERQFARVLGFLDEQLGDSDVAIILGDASDNQAYFVSNMPLKGYERHGGIYIRNMGSAKEKKPPLDRFDDRRAGFITDPSANDPILCAEVPYAWVDSEEFSSAMWPSNAEYHIFPADRVIAHEAVHGILYRNIDMIENYETNEGFAILLTVDYTRAFLPEHLCAYFEYLAGHGHRSRHARAREMAFNDQDRLRQLQAQIKERNLAIVH